LQLRAAPVQKLGGDVAHRTTIHKAQRHVVADGGIGWPSLLRADANRIWQRRRTKASDERKPASICSRSSWLKERTKIGGLMLLSIPHSQSPLLSLHQVASGPGVDVGQAG
jgi:hypothetical protein